jgi:hypothetical protein
VIEELIQLAREMRADKLRTEEARGEELGLSGDELAFYDALETNDSAVAVLRDETLKTIARKLVETVRKNATIDWTLRENVRAQLRVYSSASCASTATRPTSRSRRPAPCSSRPRCSRRGGRREGEMPSGRIAPEGRGASAVSGAGYESASQGVGKE